MLLDFIVLFLPIIYLIGIWVLNIGNKNIIPISNIPIFIFVVIMAIAMGCHEIPEFSDRAQYVNLYMSIYENTYHSEYKDFGWQFFVTLCTYFFYDNYRLFLIFVSFVYCFSYYYYAKRQFKRIYVGYFIILAFGCMGFSNYGIVTIRAGVAAGIAFVALTFEKKYLKIIYALLSVSIHLSMIIPIFFYIVALRLKNKKIPYYFWFICFVLSVLNFDLSPLLEETYSIDSRINSYTNLVTNGYKIGYRTDFLIYSMCPMIILYIYKKRGIILPTFYNQVYHTYILTNAAWLLVIRMAYTNRIAYLSWMIIPYIVLYPILQDSINKKKSKSVLYIIMFIFMGLNVALSIRDMLNSMI